MDRINRMGTQIITTDSSISIHQFQYFCFFMGNSSGFKSEMVLPPASSTSHTDDHRTWQLIFHISCPSPFSKVSASATEKILIIH